MAGNTNTETFFHLDSVHVPMLIVV